MDRWNETDYTLTILFYVVVPLRLQLSCGKSVKYRFIESVVPLLIYFLCFSSQELHFP